MTSKSKALLNLVVRIRHLIIFMVIFGVETSSHGQRMEMEKDVQFDAENMLLPPHFSPKYYYEKNERNTSIHYDLWDKADVRLLEWPGNITKLDPKYPLFKWTKSRAKYVHNVCSQDHLSMDMVAYAYKYLHLTWGPYRITQSYCPPLSVPATEIQVLDSSLLDANETELDVLDFGFVLDTLLVVTKGSIIRISGLEMAYALPSQAPEEPLQYSIAKGLTLPINKLVTQSCCSVSLWCPNGDTVLAYKEKSRHETLFISYDGGKLFKILEVSLPSTSMLIHSAVLYPEQTTVAILHGIKTWGVVDTYSIIGGNMLSLNNTKKTNLTIKGNAQMSRVGNEQSMLIWDECTIWYSYNGENTFVKSQFYINKIIYPNRTSKNSLHKITVEHCHLGPIGHIGFLDENNVFFLGMDSKRPLLQLMALKTDISLLLDNKILSLVPHFDRNNGPKLLYPPRYLRFDGLDSMTKNYSKREGMRILIKSLFPSEFMTVFYTEQVKAPDIREKYSLKECMTSSLSLNNSITQKTKVIAMAPSEKTYFYLTFTSQSSALDQLTFEPNNTLKFLNLNIKLIESMQLGLDEENHFFKYMVNISFRSLHGHRKVFLLNFYTVKELRCNHPPQQSVWIVKHIGEKPKSPIPLKDVLPPIITNSKKRKSCAAASEGLGTSGTNGPARDAIKILNKMSKMSPPPPV